MGTMLKRGDVVFFQYGAMCGEDFGTVVGVEETPWGPNYWVRKSDFTLTAVHSLAGVVTAKRYVDCNGEEFLSARGDSRIGAYLVKEITS